MANYGVRTAARILALVTVLAIAVSAVLLVGGAATDRAAAEDVPNVSVRLVRPGTPGALTLADYATTKIAVRARSNRPADPVLIVWPEASELEATTVTGTRVVFDDTTATIAFHRDDPTGFGILTGGDAELLLVVDWPAATTGPNGVEPTIVLGLRGAIGFTAGGRDIDVAGALSLSTGKLALRADDSGSAETLVPQVVDDFFRRPVGQAATEGDPPEAVAEGVSLAGTVDLAETVGDLAADESGASARVAVSGSLQTSVARFLNAGTIDTSTAFTLSGKLRSDQLFLPSSLERVGLDLMLRYTPPVPSAPEGTDGVLTVGASGTVTLRHDALGPDPMTFGADATIATDGEVTFRASFAGSAGWTVPGTDTRVVIDRVDLALAVGSEPAVTVGLGFTLGGVPASLDVTVAQSTDDTTTPPTVSDLATLTLDFGDVSLGSLAQAVEALTGAELDLGPSAAKAQISAAAELRVESVDGTPTLDLWLEGSVTIDGKRARAGLFAGSTSAPTGGGAVARQPVGFVAVQFPANISLGSLTDAALDGVFADMKLPAASVVVADRAIAVPYGPDSPLPDRAKAFLAPIYGCANASTCAEPVEAGVKLVAAIELGAIQDSLDALWVDPSTPLRVSGTLPIFGSTQDFSLSVDLPRIAPPDRAAVTSAPWFVDADVGFTIAHEGTSLSFSATGRLRALVPDAEAGRTAASLLPGDPTAAWRGEPGDTFDLVTFEVGFDVSVGTNTSFTIFGSIQGWETPFGVDWLTFETITLELKVTASPNPSIQIGFRAAVKIGDTTVDGSIALAVGPGTPIKVDVGLRLYIDTIALRDVLEVAEEFGVDGIDPEDAPPLVFKDVEFSFSTIESERLCLARGLVIGVEVHLEEDADQPTPNAATRDPERPIDPCHRRPAGPVSCTGTCLGRTRLEVGENGFLAELALADIDFGPVAVTAPTLAIQADDSSQSFEISGGIEIDGFLEAQGLIRLSSEEMRFRLLVQEAGVTNPSESFLIEASTGFGGPGGLPDSFTLRIEVISETFGDITQSFSEGTKSVVDPIVEFLGLGEEIGPLPVIRPTCLSFAASINGNDASGDVPTNGISGTMHFLLWPDGNTDLDPLALRAQLVWDFDDLVGSVTKLGELRAERDLAGCRPTPEFLHFGVIGPDAFGFVKTECTPTQPSAPDGDCGWLSALANDSIVTESLAADGSHLPVYTRRLDAGQPCAPGHTCSEPVELVTAFNTPGWGSYYLEYDQLDAPTAGPEGRFYLGTLNDQAFAHHIDLRLHKRDEVDAGPHRVRMRLWSAAPCTQADLQRGDASCVRKGSNPTPLVERVVSFHLWTDPVSDVQWSPPQQTVYEGEDTIMDLTWQVEPNADPGRYTAFASFEVRLFDGAIVRPIFEPGSLRGGSRYLVTPHDNTPPLTPSEVTGEVYVDFDQAVAVADADAGLTIVNRRPYIHGLRLGRSSRSSRPAPTLSSGDVWEGPGGLYQQPWVGLDEVVLSPAELGAGPDALRVAVDFADAGVLDTWEVVVRASDGSVSVHPVTGQSSEVEVVHPFVDGYPRGEIAVTVTVVDDDGDASDPVTRTLTLTGLNDDLAAATPLRSSADGRSWTATGTTFGATDRSGPVSDASLDARAGQCVVWFSFEVPSQSRFGENMGNRNLFAVEVDGSVRSDSTARQLLAVTMPRNRRPGSANESLENLVAFPLRNGEEPSPDVPTTTFFAQPNNGESTSEVRFGVYAPDRCGDGGDHTGPFEVRVRSLPPTNDDLGDARPVDLTLGTDREREQVNRYATDEFDEAQLLGQQANGAVWYRVDPVYTNARYRIATEATDPEDRPDGIEELDTVLAVYRGPFVPGVDTAHRDLVLLAENDDAALPVDGCVRCSEVLVDGVASGEPGDQLFVAVGGYATDGRPASGVFDVRFDALTTPPVAEEPGQEPVIFFEGNPFQRTVLGANVGDGIVQRWWLVAPSSGRLNVEVNHFGGEPVDDLVVVDPGGRPVGDDEGEFGFWSGEVEAGEAYQVAFAAPDGDFIVDFYYDQPAGDHFARSQPIEVGDAVSVVTAGSSRQHGEPFHAGVISTVHSVWYTFTPQAGRTYQVVTEDADFDTVLALYLGDELDQLVPVAANDDAGDGGSTSRLVFRAATGEPHHLAVAGYGGGRGRTGLRIGRVQLCAGLVATHVGTNRGEKIVGTPGDDVIVALGGDDIIDGGGGDDVICAGRGDDDVRGHSGDDLLIGGDGDDELDGGHGDDELDGGDGDDVLIGYVGDDFIRGGAGEDEGRGGAGVDELTGGAGDDELRGGPGTDLVSGNRGDDVLLGDGGDDDLVGGSGDDDLDGGSGDDDLSGGAGIDLLIGYTGEDLLLGGSGVDDLRGGADADELFGGPGDDVLNGGYGDDLVVGEEGSDRLQGSIGDDDLFGGSESDDLRGSDGADLLDGGPGDDELDGGSQFDVLFGGADTDTCTNGEVEVSCEV